MKLIIHDGEEAFNKALKNLFLGEKVKIIMDSGEIKACRGCFGCWVKTPGKCILQDAYNEMGKNLGHAEELILISECVYGTYSPFIKNVLDRSIPYIHPYFSMRKGEMHHKKRYSKKLRVSVYFYGEMSEQEKETARKTVKANILNFNGLLEEIKFLKRKEDLI